MTFQGPQLTNRSDTTYHQQMSKGLEWGPSLGKFQPPRMNILGHEVWMDNDLILWDLPPAWLRFTRSDEKALGNLCLTGYHGSFSHSIRHQLSSGFFGLPPGYIPRISPGPVEIPNYDQEEMGALAYYLCENFSDSRLELVDLEKEAPCYNPLSGPGSVFPIERLEWGHFGIHLSGCNRRHFNPLPILQHIKLAQTTKMGKFVPPFPLARAEECRV